MYTLADKRYCVKGEAQGIWGLKSEAGARSAGEAARAGVGAQAILLTAPSVPTQLENLRYRFVWTQVENLRYGFI